MTADELQTPFDFSKDDAKKEVHWKRDKNLRDLLIHLYEWHQLLLSWVTANMKGDEQPVLPGPYNWRSYWEMNLEFWEKRQKTSLENSKAMFEASTKKFSSLLKSFQVKNFSLKMSTSGLAEAR